MSLNLDKWQAKARMQGGRSNSRHAIFVPALVAIRHNADLKTKCEELVAAGKEKKVAITAVMRKLLVLANALQRIIESGPEKRLDQDGYSTDRVVLQASLWRDAIACGQRVGRLTKPCKSAQHPSHFDALPGSGTIIEQWCDQIRQHSAQAVVMCGFEQNAELRAFMVK
jgi:hypothetical protein